MATVQVMDYNELLQYWSSLNGQVTEQQINDWIATANSYNVSDMQAIEDLVGSSSGSIPIEFTKTADGLYNVSGVKVTAQQTINSGLPNSNVATMERSDVTRMINRGESNGKVNMSTTPASGSFAQNAAYYTACVGQAVTAASVGISLGKAIDSALYNANPDYWDSIGMSSLNPETWNSITNGDDSFGAGLFNFVFGLDPDTGNSQAYINANALAYMAMVLNANGWFDTGTLEPSYDLPVVGTTFTNNDLYVDTVENLLKLIGALNFPFYGHQQEEYEAIKNRIGVLMATGQSITNYYAVMYNSSGNSGISSTGPYQVTSLNKTDNYCACSPSITYITTLNRIVYVSNAGYIHLGSTSGTSSNASVTPGGKLTTTRPICFAVKSDVEPVIGTSDQSDATIPDTSSWDTIPNTLASLQQQFPDMFNNATVWDNVQPDGSNPQLVYVPIAWPDSTGYNDSQPTGQTATQGNTTINSNTDTLVQTLMDTLQQTQTKTETGTLIPPSNPIDVGTGDSPDIAIPTGEASALWSVYHPTQAQVNSFGAWLWGSPFLTNIGKLFQNPIDGVISLHKIFATPIDSGSGNIVVGTLDSGVSSATVNQQYVYVDCGSISINEDFSNVFDYPPYTQVSLYLPFIGIVPLDASDVMRSTLTVTYGVDVYTGACLAIVNINRDGHDVAMYQYAGMCAVSYPLGNVQHSQMVSGLLAVAGGVASLVSSGGVSAPAVIATAAGASGMAKSSIGRSGGFSGNSGAMGGKKPYLIIQRPQTRVANTFPQLAGYPTNKSGKLSNFSGQVNVSHVHVEGIPATDDELKLIEAALMSGVLI